MSLLAGKTLTGTGVRRELFRDAMCRFPSGVVIVTTTASTGEPTGFTASSFTSVSMEPPLVLFCLGLNASCYPVFRKADRFGISILSPEHISVAKVFATRDADKFSYGKVTVGLDGNYFINDALAMLSCVPVMEVPSGDHSIFVAHVESVELGGNGAAIVSYHRSFHEIGAKALSQVARCELEATVNHRRQRR